MEYVSQVSELNYMTQVVIMLYEDPTKDPSSDERFHVELHFSPGVNCCIEKDLPPGPGFRPHSRNQERDPQRTPTTTNTTNATSPEVDSVDCVCRAKPISPSATYPLPSLVATIKCSGCDVDNLLGAISEEKQPVQRRKISSPSKLTLNAVKKSVSVADPAPLQRKTSLDHDVKKAKFQVDDEINNWRQKLERRRRRRLSEGSNSARSQSCDDVITIENTQGNVEEEEEELCKGGATCSARGAITRSRSLDSDPRFPVAVPPNDVSKKIEDSSPQRLAKSQSMETIGEDGRS